MSSNGSPIPENSHTVSSQINPSAPIQEDLVNSCLQAVEQFRGSFISKWEVISRIFATLESAISTPEQQTGAGESYLQMLDNHKCHISQAHSCRQTFGCTSSPSRPQDQQTHATISRSPTPNNEPNSKKPRYNESLYMWHIVKQILPITLSLNLQ